MKISIITPIYNLTTEKFTKSLDSVIDQTIDSWEWILVMDGGDSSPKLLMEILRSYSADLSKIKVAYLNDNYGPSVARNVGFSLSDGDVISYLDLGDIMNPERMEHLFFVYTTYPETKLMFDDYYIKQTDNVRLYSLYDITTAYGSDIRELLDKGNVSTPLGVSHTRDIFVEVGGFQPGIVCGEDGILWRRMLEKLSDEEILITDKKAGVYFVEPDSQARTQRRFDRGGFAFDAKDPAGSHGQSLDGDWYKEYNSRKLMDGYKPEE